MARRRHEVLEDYEVESEGVVHLGDDEPATKPVRLKSAAACASQKHDYAWLRTELCVSRQGGTYKDVPSMTDPAAVSRFVHKIYPVANAAREIGLVLVVDIRHRPVGLFEVGAGGLREMAIDLSVVLRGVLLLGGTGFFFFHNHPSGEPVPSMEDHDLTRKIKAAAETLKVKFLDHLILTHDPETYYSFFAS